MLPPAFARWHCAQCSDEDLRPFDDRGSAASAASGVRVSFAHLHLGSSRASAASSICI